MQIFRRYFALSPFANVSQSNESHGYLVSKFDLETEARMLFLRKNKQIVAN